MAVQDGKKAASLPSGKMTVLLPLLEKKLSYEMVKILLEHGKVGFRGCVSQRGNKFSAYFHYEKDEKTGRYNWRLEFIDTNPPTGLNLSSYSKKTPTSKVGDELRLLPT